MTYLLWFAVHNPVYETIFSQAHWKRRVEAFAADISASSDRKNGSNNHKSRSSRKRKNILLKKNNNPALPGPSSSSSAAATQKHERVGLMSSKSVEGAGHGRELRNLKGEGVPARGKQARDGFRCEIYGLGYACYKWPIY